ncbi:MAG: flagellar filament capping protein FliD [Myxococcales bacterium]|nr:flagellar filament capping protein FliD [Myxococcales bacterium]
MSVMIDGVFSGFDTTALIDAVLATQATGRDLMQAQRDAEQRTLDKISELSGLLKDLSTAADDLKSGATDTYKATVAEGAGFTATTSSGAVPGTYDVSVISLAASEMETSQGFASSSASGTVAQGTLTVSIAGEDVDVTIDGTNDSLSGLASSLNQVDGLSAYVLNTGADTDPYQLVVQSTESGEDNTLSFDTSGLAGGTVPTFTEVQAGADAELTINGLTVFSASNQVKSVPGLTIGITEAGLGASTVEVVADEDALQEQLQAFVDTYNAVFDQVQVNSVFDAENGIEGPLVGESSVRRVLGGLGDLVSNPYSTGGTFSILAEVGIETTQTGELELDTEALSDALESGFGDALTLLTSDDGPLAALITEIDDVYVDPDSGSLESREDSLQSSIEDLEERIADEDDRLADQAALLRTRFTAMEQIMAELQSTTQFLSTLFTQTSTTT